MWGRKKGAYELACMLKNHIENESWCTDTVDAFAKKHKCKVQYLGDNYVEAEMYASPDGFWVTSEWLVTDAYGNSHKFCADNLHF